MKYAGIGSRSTPTKWLHAIENIASLLYIRGVTLRSGGAVGADRAFERGAREKKEIFYAEDATKESDEVAKLFHPCWTNLSQYAKKLHSRNAMQILGRELNDHVDFVLCWTNDGCNSNKTRTPKTCGTGTAILIADYYEIPVYNLNNDFDRLRIIDLFERLQDNE